MSSPKESARTLLTAWMHGRNPEDCFPVDCRAIAEGFNIVVQGADFSDEFQGGLFIQPDLKAILYNENIRETGRINFTIGHELGHFCLHRDRKELRCTLDDLDGASQTPPHGPDIEKEANSFAASLLMPAIDLASQSKERQRDLQLVQTLAARYNTSVTATACRLAELSGAPTAVIMVDGNKVAWCFSNPSFKGLFIRKGFQININFEESLTAYPVNQEVWFPNLNYNLWQLSQSKISMQNYSRALILLQGRKG